MLTDLQREQIRARRAALATMPLTAEERERWADMFRDTWQAIGPDAEPMLSQRSRKAEIVELVCDANRVEMYGGMTREEYDFLGVCYRRDTFQRWAKKVLNY